jgi:hypothetical protein
MKNLEDMFKYNAGVKPENGIRISPSGIKDFIKNRPHWIKSNVLGIRKQDDMSNANIGTIIHAMIEGVYLKIEPNDILQAGLDYFDFSDRWHKEEMLNIMFKSYMEDYYPTDMETQQNELWLEFKPNDRIIISGTCDRISNGVLIDYKSSASKVSRLDSYRSQLYLYAFMARQQGIDVHSIRVVGIPRPKLSEKTDKWGVCTVTSITEGIDEEYMQRLIGLIQEASKDILQVLDEPKILNWLESTQIQDPYDRSHV